jgi:acetyltransferase-like isoleucine patch superfamily enzyme
MILFLMKKIKRFFFTSLALGWSSRNDVYINGYSRFTKKTSLGQNVHFNGMIIKGRGDVKIGNHFHSGTGCKIITDVHNYNGQLLPYDQTYLVKNVTIGDCVWLGEDVIVLGGVSIGHGVIIQAGSVVVSNIPSCAIAGGHPARVFSHRDQEHYDNLYSSGYFN